MNTTENKDVTDNESRMNTTENKDVINNESRIDEIKNLINVEEKRWNTHMLRVCTKCMCDLPKKDFKKKRYIATLCKNVKLEKQILEQMLCDKAITLSTNEEYVAFYKRLCEFESKRVMHPRRKYIDY